MARRIGLFVLVVAVLLGGRLLFQRPLEVTLALGFGKRSAELRKAELVVSDSGDHVVRTLQLAFEKGAGAEERRLLKLRPGDYTIGARLLPAAGEAVTLSRPLRIGEAGTYPVDLSF